LRALVLFLAPGLQALAQVAQEASGQRAVDSRWSSSASGSLYRPDRDRVVPELVLDDPRPLTSVRAEDSGLRLLMIGVP